MNAKELLGATTAVAGGLLAVGGVFGIGATLVSVGVDSVAAIAATSASTTTGNSSTSSATSTTVVPSTTTFAQAQSSGS